MIWTGWSLERVVFLFVGIAFLAVWVQVTLSHYRQNFHHKSMWSPVISSPIYSLAAIWIAVSRPDWLLSLFVFLMWLGVMTGAAGFYYHFHGVGLRVGGYSMRNFLVGPPVMMPIMYMAISVLGLIAYYWR